MSEKPQNLVLTGFMGTGKSTTGRLAAGQLDFVFVDTDIEIISRAGLSIAEIFTQQGEPAFRQLEAEVCLSIAAQSGQVVATGGGALLNSCVYESFAASLIICLTCDLDEIIRRVGDTPSRPLFVADRERLGRLLASRADYYARFPHQIDTTFLSPQQAAQEVIYLWQKHI
jgi:shikimate kinase